MSVNFTTRKWRNSVSEKTRIRPLPGCSLRLIPSMKLCCLHVGVLVLEFLFDCFRDRLCLPMQSVVQLFETAQFESLAPASGDSAFPPLAMLVLGHLIPGVSSDL